MNIPLRHITYVPKQREDTVRGLMREGWIYEGSIKLRDVVLCDEYEFVCLSKERIDDEGVD